MPCWAATEDTGPFGGEARCHLTWVEGQDEHISHFAAGGLGLASQTTCDGFKRTFFLIGGVSFSSRSRGVDETEMAACFGIIEACLD
jgi:hypothetical protein